MVETLDTYSPQALASQPAGETATAALVAQAKALVEARFVMALRRPRDLDAVRQALLKECARPGFADSAIYHKPVGNGIEGPSIRFAEAAIRVMTNISPDTITIFDDAERRIVRVSVTDLEANVCYSQDVTITKTVERRSLKRGETALKTRVNSKQEVIYILEATDDDILNKQNALISKALRTLGLRLLPGDIQDECMDACRKVRADRAAKDPDAARKALFDGFDGVGVKVPQLKEWLGHEGATLNPKEYAELRGLFAALRDGETTWREIMDARQSAPGAAPVAPGAAPAPAPPSPGSSLKDAIRGGAKGEVIAAPADPAPSLDPEPPAAAAPSDPPPAVPAAPPPAAEPKPAAPSPTPSHASATPAGSGSGSAEPPAAGWLSDAQKKLLFAKGKPFGASEAVVKHIIASLDKMAKADGRHYFDIIADGKPEASELWKQASETVAKRATPPPPPPMLPEDGFVPERDAF